MAALSGDSATVAELRADLVPLADEDELGRFDASRGEARQQFLRQFWEDRARRDLRAPGERIREHYRRLRYARQQFVLSNNRRYHGLRDLYRAPRSETLDDRGVVYVRHGEPDQRIRPQLFGLLPNETWLYRRADGDLLLHFSAGGEGMEGGDLTDYRLVPSVFDLRGIRAHRDMLIASRFEVSNLYEKIMAWGPLGARRVIQEERQWGVASAVTGTRDEGFELRFTRPLEARTDLVAIGRRDGKALLQVIYSLPGIDAGAPVRLRLALFDSAGGAHAWLDSAGQSEPMDGKGSGGRFELPVPSGSWFYRMALEVGSAGMVTPRTQVVVPEHSPDRLALSGLALGQPAGNLKWPTGPADTAQVNPNHEFQSDGELQLYYEVFGLTRQSRYTASVNVLERRRERAGRNRLRFTFEEEGQEGITRIRRSIRLTSLAPGEYWLEVGVRDESGRLVTVRKAFVVLAVTH
jgi:GWxTD domain-containing protein